jgi:hypothetical protein
MAEFTQDTVLPDVLQESRIEDRALPEVPQPEAKSKELDNLFAAQAAGIDTYLNGTDIGENVGKYKQILEPKKAVEVLSMQKAQADSQAITEEFVVNPTVGDNPVETNLLATSTARQQAIADATNPDKQFIESITTTPEGLANLEKNTGRMKLQRMLMEAQADVSGWDVAAGFGGSVLPFVDSVTQGLLTGDILGGQDVMETAIVRYKNLPVEEQLRLFPALKEELIDHLGEWNGVTTLSKFITPGGEDDLGEFNAWWRALDAVDIVGVAAVAKGFLDSRTMVKTLTDAGDKPLAVKANINAMTNPETAETLGTTTQTATSSVLPFDLDVNDIARSDHFSDASIRELDEFFKEADTTAGNIIQGNGFLKEGIVDTADRVIAEEKAAARFRKAGHEEIEIIESGDNFTTFSYKARDEDGNLLPETYTLNLDLDAVGTWKQTDISIGSELIASPTVWAKGSTRRSVDQAQRLDYLDSKVNKQLTDTMVEALKPLGSVLKPNTKKRIAKIDKALREGDEYKNVDGSRGKVFNTDELHSVYGLDEAEMQTYFRMNRVFNNLFNIANNTKREEMLALKYKGIRINDAESTYGKVLETATGGLESLRKAEVRYVYDAEAGKAIPSSGRQGWLDDAYDQEKVLVHLDTPYETGIDGVGKAKFALVNKNSVGELPTTVLNRKVGYVPRSTDEAAYFVKEIFPDTIDGVVSSRKETLRFFSNKAEADKFREQKVREYQEKGLGTAEEADRKFVSLSDREEETISSAIGDFSHGSGGLYTGARAQDDILFGLDGDKAVRVNAFESLTRNIATVSRATSINEWRLGMEQKWINSVNQYLKSIGASGRVESFGGLPDTVRGSEAGAFFSKMEKQIRDWQGFPSREEQIWQGAMQRTLNWAADKGAGKNLLGVIGTAKSKDPIAAARGVAFHSLLGYYNPAHLWIQAQGTAVSLSLAAGKYAGKVTRNATALTGLGEGAIDAGSVRFKLAAKASAETPEELEAIHGLWKKTGLGDTVLQTADHAAATKGHGITAEALRRVADRGLFFYRNGELTNRRTAFLTALERYKDTKNLDSVKGLSDDALKEVFDDTNNILLNMGKANRAQWQKGIFSLPTQFLQVTTKSMETMTGINGNFSPSEISRMMTGQLALYGTAGIPLISLPIMWAMEAGGLTQEDVDNNPSLVKAINDGFWGVTSHWMLGADIEVSERGSLLRGASDLVERILSSEATLATAMLGATGTTGQRVWDSFTKQMRPITLGVHEASPIDVVKIPTLSALSGISSWRNGEKAVVMHALNRINDKHGDPIVNKDFSVSDEVGALIGFRLSDEERGWDLTERERHYQSVKKKIGDMVIEMQNTYALRSETSGISEEYQEEFDREMSFLMKIMENPLDNIEISEAVQKRILRDSKLEMAVSRYKDRLINSTADGVSAGKALLGSKILILNPPEEQEEK